MNWGQATRNRPGHGDHEHEHSHRTRLVQPLKLIVFIYRCFSIWTDPVVPDDGVYGFSSSTAFSTTSLMNAPPSRIAGSSRL